MVFAFAVVPLYPVHTVMGSLMIPDGILQYMAEEFNFKVKHLLRWTHFNGKLETEILVLSLIHLSIVLMNLLLILSMLQKH